MGWLFSRFRFLFTIIRGGEPYLFPPSNLRAQFGAESGGSYPVTVLWDAPADWGNEEGGTHTRGYQLNYRQILNGDGSAYTGTNTFWPAGANLNAITRTEAQTSHIQPSAPEGSVWEFRVRATNTKNEHSDWNTFRYHAVEQAGFLLLDHKFLRVFDSSTNPGRWKRLRLP